MRAGLKAVVVVVLAALFMGGLALVAPAAPLHHATAGRSTDITIRTGMSSDTTTHTVRATEFTIR
jgi:hypothetical protein